MPKPSDVFRIAVIGDSLTMGSGVSVEDTYASRVEAALNEPRADRRYEVLNIGLAALNLSLSVDRLEKIGLQYDPDLVVYGFTPNDLEGPGYRVITPRKKDPSPSHLLRLVEPRWRWLRDLFLPYPDSYVSELDWNYFKNPAAWSSFTSGLDRLGAISEERDLCIEILVHTKLRYLNAFHPFRRHYDRVAEAATERGFHVTQSLPYFLGKNGRALWVHKYDAHPNASAHRILARALLVGLEQLPQSCWADSPPSWVGVSAP
jgi:lysophospholipase L1-like esterase